MDGYWQDGKYILVSTLQAKYDAEREKVAKLEMLLFKLGAMRNAPCFKCGYNGEGYYQADKHPCAHQHHKLCENDYC